MMIGAAAIACALLVSARGLAQDESPPPIAEEKQEAAQGRADDGDDVTERPQAGAEDPLHAQLIRGLLDHLRKTDELNLTVPDFPQGKEWFNSLPLSFERELKGKIVILDFWTYCCINCIHVLPELARLEEKYASRPVAFVGVHSAKFGNERVSENIRQAVLRYDILHPVVNDDEMELWNRIGVRAWPTLAVVGPRGNLILLASGEGHGELLDAFIEVALGYYSPEVFRNDPLPIRLERDRRDHESPLRFPGKLAVDPDKKRLFISDSNHHRIVVTDLDGRTLDVIGTGEIGLDDGPFERATFHRLQGLAYHEGILWVADTENHALRRIDLEARTVTTVAGNGVQNRFDYVGGRKGREQSLSTPWDVAVHDGDVLIAMAGTHQIWIHDPDTGVTSNWSGTGAERNFNSGIRLHAAWAQPSGLTIGAGSLFVADSESSSVRAVDLESGATRTIVGGDDSSPENLFAFGDRDGTGDAAKLQHPLGVLWLESKRRVLVADSYNHRLKLVDPEARTIESWVGTGKAGFRDGPAGEAQLSEPAGFALAPDGKSVLVADTNNHRVRVVDLESGAVRTLELKDVPPPLPPVPRRRLRLADLPGTPVVRTDALRARAESEGKLALELSLPEGFHFAPGTESRWQVIDDPDMPLRFDEAMASGALGASAIEVPFRAPSESRSGIVRVEALAYFCEDEGSCRIGAVLFEVPVEVVARDTDPSAGEGNEPFVLRHTFPDLSTRTSFLELPKLDAKREPASTEE